MYPLKILHVTGKYTLQGGVQQYILGVGRLLEKAGHKNVVLYTEQSPLTIRDGNWPAHHVQTTADIAAQVQYVLNTEKPDVAYVHHVSSPELIAILAIQLPSVAYVHGVNAVCPGLGKYYRRGDVVCERQFGWGCFPIHYLRRCSAGRNPVTVARLMRNTSELKQALLGVSRILVGSNYMADLLKQNRFVARKVSVLPPHFLPDDTILSYIPPEKTGTMLYAGRLEIEKGFPYLVKALAELPPDVRLFVAGDGSQRAYYEKMAEDLGVASRIRFLGWLDETTLNQVIRACNLVVIPSICPESFGKTGVDALTQGRPVVAFNVGGISDWLRHGVNGLLVEPRNVSLLVQSISDLLDNPERCQDFGCSGQRMVAECYRANNHLSNLLQIFDSVIWPNDLSF